MRLRNLVTISAAAFFGFGVIAAPASAALCASASSCQLILNEGNSSSGFNALNGQNLGTVNLTLNSGSIDVTVTLNSGWRVINTGFPGSFGFSTSLDPGSLTVSGLPSGYSGISSSTTSNLHFDGFGSFNTAVATTGPSAGSGSGLQSVSFKVTDSLHSFTNVNQLVNIASPVGGDGAAYFVVDAFNSNTTGAGAGNTGLLGVGGTAVPEPSSYLTILLVSVGVLGLVGHRRSSAKENI